MSRIEAVLRRAARDLESLGRRWALIGGLAVSARTEPRFTRDVDVVIQVSDDADAEELVRRLNAQGYRILGIVEQEAAARLATARLVPGGENEGTALVDLLFASSGIEAEVVAGADVLEVLPGLRVPVATVGHLIALSSGPGRPHAAPGPRGSGGALARRNAGGHGRRQGRNPADRDPRLPPPEGPGR